MLKRINLKSYVVILCGVKLRRGSTSYKYKYAYLSKLCHLLSFQPFLSTMKLDTLATLLWLTLISTTESTQPPFSCDSSLPLTKSLKFCQSALPISVRAKDLVSRLTLDEKISQLVNSAPAIPRLGIPAYEWWSESLHGVGAAGRGIFFNGSINGATSFPQVILTAASFDENLWYRIGQVRTNTNSDV